jgi:hypothetical protein
LKMLKLKVFSVVIVNVLTLINFKDHRQLLTP